MIKIEFISILHLLVLISVPGVSKADAQMMFVCA